MWEQIRQAGYKVTISKNNLVTLKDQSGTTVLSNMSISDITKW